MGWWKIDPATGKATEDVSALSHPPDFILINAVPGVDDDAKAHYLGDAPWDFSESFVEEVRQVLGERPKMSKVDAEKFLSTRAVPRSFDLKAPAAKDLKAQVKRFWGNVDELYREEWGRKATAAEKRWIRRYALDDLTKPPKVRRLDATSTRGAPVELTLSHEHGTIDVHLYKPRSREGASIELPAKVLAAAIDEPTFRLNGQARVPGGPFERVLISSVKGKRRRLKITGPMGKGPEAIIAEEDFRRAFNTITGKP